MSFATFCALAATCAPLAAPLATLHARAEPRADAPPRFEFSSGAHALAARGIGDATEPAAIAREDVALDWSAPAAFERWRAALEAATPAGLVPSTSPAGTPPFGAASSARPARARLALHALRQGRADDAWVHWSEAAADPALAAALLPRFLPGIAPDAAVGRGGLPAPLADGATLAPALPPRAQPAASGRVERRSMRVAGFVVGEAVLALRVTVEPEGVQVDVGHVSGGAARVAVRLPVEPGFRLANEYVNWYAAQTPGAAHVLEIRPGDEEHTLYGRFEHDRDAVRFALPADVPAVVATGGLAIRPGPDPGADERAQALARALAGAPLRVEARVVPRGAPGAEGGRAALEIDLADPRRAQAKVAALLGAVERFVLR